MITVTVTEGLEFSIIYHMEGVKCIEVLTKDFWVALNEVRSRMQLEMGLAKGKHLTSTEERLK